MQIPVDFENEGTWINRYLLDAMYLIRLTLFSMLWLTQILTCGSKYNFRLIMVLKKKNKNIVELLASIYE